MQQQAGPGGLAVLGPERAQRAGVGGRFFADGYYVGVLGDTLLLGAIVTVVALPLGDPLAYHLARTRPRWKPLLVGIVIRGYGWMILLADRGLINATLVERGYSFDPTAAAVSAFAIGVALLLVVGIARFMGLEEFTGF